MTIDPTGVVCALVVAGAAGALGNMVGKRRGFRAGFARGADAQLAPKGPAVTNADVAKECRHSHAACGGRGTIKGGTELCPKARQRFERRNRDKLVMWNGRLHFKDPRAAATVTQLKATP